jgi:hypothetical protein
LIGYKSNFSKLNFLSEHFRFSRRHCKMRASFPLTPALYLGEKEEHSRSAGEITTGFCTTTHEFNQAGQRLFPLPKGEGQGEGKRSDDFRRFSFDSGGCSLFETALILGI